MKLELARLVGYKWLAYPVVVGGAAIVVAGQVLASGGVAFKLRSGWTEVQEHGAKVEKLKARLGTLEKVGEVEADEELKKLLVIVPATKQLLPIISGLRVAATRAGVGLEGYSAAGGDIKGRTGGQNLRVDASVAGDWPAVVQFVTETERLLPMRRVIEASFVAGKARVVVEGRWAPLAKVVDVGGKDVPDYRASLSEALAVAGGYELPGGVSESDSAAGGVNPGLF